MFVVYQESFPSQQTGKTTHRTARQRVGKMLCQTVERMTYRQVGKMLSQTAETTTHRQVEKMLYRTGETTTHRWVEKMLYRTAARWIHPERGWTEWLAVVGLLPGRSSVEGSEELRRTSR
jgi:hypothetical protein